MSAALPLDLSGRMVLITGASSGIGRATAILLSRLGARLVLVARNRERLCETLQALEGGPHVVEPYDLASVEGIPNWFRGVAEKAGPLHGVVHCAGAAAFIPLKALTAQKFEQIIRINLTASVMLAKAFRQKGCWTETGGCLVFLSSVAGMRGASGMAAYSASKAALTGLTKSLAVELAPDRIRVNCIVPGMVQGEMLDRLAGSLLPRQVEAIESDHPLGFGRPEDVAHAIAYVLADTGRWITGTALAVDGGYLA